MDDKQLIAKIQLLKTIKPTEEWVLSCRNRLAFRIEMDRKKNLLKRDTFALKELFAFLGSSTRQPAFLWVQALIIAITVVLAGGTLTVWASIQSLPGSPLYPIKIAIEKARVSISLSDESRLQLQAHLADTRLQELTGVVNSQDSAQQKAEKMSQVVEGIQNQLTTVNNQLPKAGAKAEPQKALAAAKMVSDKAGQAGKALAVAKESLAGDIKTDLSVKLTEATQALDKAKIGALETMLANQGISSTTREEIADKLSEEIKLAEEEISAKEKNLADNSPFADKLPIRAVLINQFEQGLELLNKSKEALATDDLEEALEMLKAAKAIISGTDEMTENAIIPEIKGAASSSPVDNTNN